MFYEESINVLGLKFNFTFRTRKEKPTLASCVVGIFHFSKTRENSGIFERKRVISLE